MNGAEILMLGWFDSGGVCGGLCNYRDCERSIDQASHRSADPVSWIFKCIHQVAYNVVLLWSDDYGIFRCSLKGFCNARALVMQLKTRT